MWFFTGDEHFYHQNSNGRGIIQYADRPYSSLEEMNESIISNHNSVVGSGDTVIHAGDFAFTTKSKAFKIIERLNGTHIFLKGCHDHWMPKSGIFHRGNVHGVGYMYSRKFGNNHIVVCHYCMRKWPRSHYNSWNLFAHSHGKLDGIGKQHDIGVDTQVEGIHERFFPYSLDEIIEIMKTRPDNPGYIKKGSKES